MLGTLTPLGERSRQNTWAITIAIYAVGSALGGAVVGALFGTAGWFIAANVPYGRDVALVAFLGVALVALTNDFGLSHVPLPHLRRQVDDRWLSLYRRWVYAGGFGLQLGAGLITHVVSAATYATFAAAFATGSPSIGALIGGVYGAVRGATALATWPARSQRGLLQVNRWAYESERVVRTLTLRSLQLVTTISALAICAKSLIGGAL